MSRHSIFGAPRASQLERLPEAPKTTGGYFSDDIRSNSLT